MEENQSVRMEELPSMIDFPSFPLRIGWRMEWIYRGRGRGGAMEVGSSVVEKRMGEKGREGWPGGYVLG